MREGRRRCHGEKRKRRKKKTKKKNEWNLVSTGVERKEKKKKKKKEYGVFELMLFWYNFLVFVEVVVCD
jgi:hypothetical protein